MYDQNTGVYKGEYGCGAQTCPPQLKLDGRVVDDGN